MKCFYFFLFLNWCSSASFSEFQLKLFFDKLYFFFTLKGQFWYEGKQWIIFKQQDQIFNLIFYFLLEIHFILMMFE